MTWPQFDAVESWRDTTDGFFVVFDWSSAVGADGYPSRYIYAGPDRATAEELRAWADERGKGRRR